MSTITQIYDTIARQADGPKTKIPAPDTRRVISCLLDHLAANPADMLTISAAVAKRLSAKKGALKAKAPIPTKAKAPAKAKMKPTTKKK